MSDGFDDDFNDYSFDDQMNFYDDDFDYVPYDVDAEEDNSEPHAPEEEFYDPEIVEDPLGGGDLGSYSSELSESYSEPAVPIPIEEHVIKCLFASDPIIRISGIKDIPDLPLWITADDFETHILPTLREFLGEREPDLKPAELFRPLSSRDINIATFEEPSCLPRDVERRIESLNEQQINHSMRILIINHLAALGEAIVSEDALEGWTPGCVTAMLFPLCLLGFSTGIQETVYASARATALLAKLLPPAEASKGALHGVALRAIALAFGYPVRDLESPPPRRFSFITEAAAKLLSDLVQFIPVADCFSIVLPILARLAKKRPIHEYLLSVGPMQPRLNRVLGTPTAMSQSSHAVLEGIFPRKTATSALGAAASFVPPHAAQHFVVPIVRQLSRDSNWGIRRAVTSSIPGAAHTLALEGRVQQLAPILLALVCDVKSGFVRPQAREAIAPFFAAFGAPDPDVEAVSAEDNWAEMDATRQDALKSVSEAVSDRLGGEEEDLPALAAERVALVAASSEVRQLMAVMALSVVPRAALLETDLAEVWDGPTRYEDPRGLTLEKLNDPRALEALLDCFPDKAQPAMQDAPAAERVAESIDSVHAAFSRDPLFHSLTTRLFVKLIRSERREIRATAIERAPSFLSHSPLPLRRGILSTLIGDAGFTLTSSYDDLTLPAVALIAALPKLIRLYSGADLVPDLRELARSPFWRVRKAIVKAAAVALLDPCANAFVTQITARSCPPDSRGAQWLSFIKEGARDGAMAVRRVAASSVARVAHALSAEAEDADGFVSAFVEEVLDAAGAPCGALLLEAFIDLGAMPGAVRLLLGRVRGGCSVGESMRILFALMKCPVEILRLEEVVRFVEAGAADERHPSLREAALAVTERDPIDAHK